MNCPLPLSVKAGVILRPRALIILLVLIVIATMGRVATHEFVDWDDHYLISNNPKFNPPTLPAIVGYLLPKNADENLYIPTTQVFWGILASIGHTIEPDASGSYLNPWVFHCANLALHLGSAALVFAILRSLFADGPAWIGAVTFAIHPVQVETVAWASGGRDLLAGFLGFICLYQLIRYRQTKRRARWIFATIAVALAMLAKPSAVTVPLAAIVVDRMLLCTRWRDSLAAIFPWFLFTIPIVLVTRSVQPIVWPTHTPIVARPLIALDAIAFYCVKLLLPIRLVFDYGRTPQAVLAQGWRWMWLIPMVLAIVIFCIRRRSPAILAGALIALASITPVLGFVPFMAQDYSTVSDHYLYFSMLGVSLIIAAIVEGAVRSIDTRAVYSVALSMIAVMAFLSFNATGVWSDSLALFSNALSINPNSSNAHTGMGFILAADGNVAAALAQFEAAEHLNHHNGMAIMGLANLLLREGDLDAAAIQYERLMGIYQMQSNFDPKLGAAGELVIAARLMRRGDSAGAIAALEKAQRWNPLDTRINQALSSARGTPSTRSASVAHAAP